MSVWKNLFFLVPLLHHFHPSLVYFFFVFERDKSEARYRYRCHMVLNEKALLSKQMGFLNIETAACLFNMTVLNLSLFHHFDKLPQPLCLSSLSLSASLSIFLNLESLRRTSAYCDAVQLMHLCSFKQHTSSLRKQTNLIKAIGLALSWKKVILSICFNIC